LLAGFHFPVVRAIILTGTFTTALQKYITITSILPRQDENRTRTSRGTRVEACEEDRCGASKERSEKRSTSEREYEVDA